MCASVTSRCAHRLSSWCHPHARRGAATATGREEEDHDASKIDPRGRRNRISVRLFSYRRWTPVRRPSAAGGGATAVIVKHRRKRDPEHAMTGFM